MKYERPLEWLKQNKHAPLSTIIYVATVAVAVKIKDIIQKGRSKILVEMYNADSDIPFATMILPRIVILDEQHLLNKVIQVISDKILV